MAKDLSNHLVSVAGEYFVCAELGRLGYLALLTPKNNPLFDVVVTNPSGTRGVYAIAYTPSNLSGRPFSWRREIIYIGMTNSVLGLKGRLKQFDNTIAGNTGHGGADRVRYKYRNYGNLVKRLYVAVVPFQCDTTSNQPKDLKTMGEVAKFEYLCFARFVERFGKLPDFNNKKESLKYSLTVGRNDR